MKARLSVFVRRPVRESAPRLDARADFEEVRARTVGATPLPVFGLILIERSKASVFWQFQGDQQFEDEFWS